MSLVTLYLFENEADLLDRLDKLSNIIFAVSTFLLSIWIFIHTVVRENRKDKKTQKLDFLKSILLENNSVHFFNFYDNSLDFISSQVGLNLSDQDKGAIVELLVEEHRKFRIKFYDLILPFNQEVYNSIKDDTDNLIDNLTIKFFDPNINYFDTNNISQLEQSILTSRSAILKTILNIK